MLLHTHEADGNVNHYCFAHARWHLGNNRRNKKTEHNKMTASDSFSFCGKISIMEKDSLP